MQHVYFASNSGKNINGSTWNVEASAVQKWNGEAVAGAAGGHAGDPSRPVTYYKLAHNLVPEQLKNCSSNIKNYSEIIFFRNKK